MLFLYSFLSKDPCYEVRDKFTKKLHKAEDVLKLPLEYLGIFALAAPEPVKERKTQVKYCKVQHFEKMKTRTRLTDVCGILENIKA